MMELFDFSGNEDLIPSVDGLEGYPSHVDIDMSVMEDTGLSIDDNTFGGIETEMVAPDFNPVGYNELSFQSRQTLLVESPDSGNLLEPFDYSVMEDLSHRMRDPVGTYSARFTGGFLTQPDLDPVHIDLREDFSVSDIQYVCDTICDTMNWPHIPVSVTEAVPNAAFSPGLFARLSFDDCLYLNPVYAHQCIDHIGSTDIVVADMAHEVGHAIATKICGNMGTFVDEKIADFISGFVCAKMGLDIDVAREWFEWFYDSEGRGGYPVSEERWDAQAAGYYFGHFATSENLLDALHDPKFINIIEDYRHDRVELVNEMAWSQYTNVETEPGYGQELMDRIKDLNSRYHLGPQIARLVKGLHLKI